MPPPDPPVQMRGMLAVSKRQAVPFDDAWRGAWRQVKWPHPTEDRRAYKAILDEHRDAWRAAYEDEPAAPGLAVLARLAELLELFEERSRSAPPQWAGELIDHRTKRRAA